tara:strand:- start:687 stop:1118 length:432 start_codon:yes stop_codon:yes gene_type:complete
MKTSNIDWEKLRIAKTMNKAALGDFQAKEEMNVPQLKEECKRRGLKTSGSKKDLQARLNDYDKRMAVLAEEQQLNTLENMRIRMEMQKDYVEAAIKEYDDMRPTWNDIVVRRDTTIEELEQVTIAYEKFKENLEIQGIDTTDF